MLWLLVTSSWKRTIKGASTITKPSTKVLYFYNGTMLGGAPLSLLYLIQALDKSRLHPAVCCLYDSPVVKHFRDHGIETFVAKGIQEINHTTAGWYPLYSPMGLWQILRKTLLLIPSAMRSRDIIKEQKADLVHLNSIILLPCAIGAKLAGVPLVWHVRESVVKGHFGLRRLVLRWLVNALADEVIYICKYNKKALGSKGTVIYNFVDFDKFDKTISGQTVRQELGIGRDEKIVLMLGGIGRIKGTLKLVKAIDLLKEKMPNIRCLITGTLPPPPWASSLPLRTAHRFGFRRYTEQVQEFVHRQNLGDYVKFLPFTDNVPHFIAASDVVVFPSTRPHFARPVIEAGAMAKPIVASRIGGVEEVIDNGLTGLLVPPRDHKALANALLQILQNPEIAKKMGRNGFEKAKSLFDAKVNTKRITDIYERLLSKTQTRSPTEARV